MKHLRFHLKWMLEILVAQAIVLGALVSCSGTARDLNKGAPLGPPVLPGGETRSDGNDFGQIYTVTSIVEATDNIPEWTDADLPFTSGRNSWNITTQNKQWPFKFSFAYPANNYKLNEAHIVIVTQRDSSDTEAIFIDGVMTGRPPGGNVSTTSTQVTHRHYVCQGACSGAAVPTTPSNTYFMDRRRQSWPLILLGKPMSPKRVPTTSFEVRMEQWQRLTHHGRQQSPLG